MKKAQRFIFIFVATLLSLLASAETQYEVIEIANEVRYPQINSFGEVAGMRRENNSVFIWSQFTGYQDLGIPRKGVGILHYWL